MADSTHTSFSESDPHQPPPESHTINEDQPWSTQPNGSALNSDPFRRLESESGSVPTRRSTAPTASSSTRQKQTHGSVGRAQTTHTSRPHGRTTQSSSEQGRLAYPNVLGYPENYHPPSHQGTFNTYSSGPLEKTKDWDQKSILSLDGGGIRGYSTLLIIQELMKAVGIEEKKGGQRKDGEYPGPATSSLYPVQPPKDPARETHRQSHQEPDSYSDSSTLPWLPCHYFDYMAGTSTGGLISIMLGRLRMNVDDCIAEYENLGAKIFARPRWFHVRTMLFCPREKYDHKVLKAVIQTLVKERVPKIDKFPGGKTFAADENRCRVAVISYQEDKSEKHQHAYLFRTYKNIRPGCTEKERKSCRNPGPAHDIPIWQVARATSAAPTYFKEVSIEDSRYIDGGFGTNNPCKEIVDEVRKMNNFNDHCIKCVISIGTGLKKHSRMSPYSKFKMILTANLAKFITYLHFSAQLASQSEGTHEAVQQLQTDLKYCFDYERFNVDEGLEDMKLDEWKARWPLTVSLGKLIGKIKPKRKLSQPNAMPLADLNNKTSNSKDAAGEDDHVGNSAVDNKNAGIPKCLQDRNKTLEKIRAQTAIYLQKEDVHRRISECAVKLVESRRRRIAADEQRWRRACYGTWYQCRFPGCPRGETEYHDERMMHSHLKEKHGEHFEGDTEEYDRLIKEKIAEFAVIIE